MRWGDFEHAAAEIAAAGRRLLTGPDGVAIGFLATVGDGSVHISPVCPIFCRSSLFLIAVEGSPKTSDLRIRGAYALHAFLGQNDEEFQIAGRAAEIVDAEERADVHGSVRFAAFNRSDPIFALDVDRALWVYWERVGQPDTKAVRRRWAPAS